MDLHNDEQGWYWSYRADSYERNETAVCNAMRNRTNVATRVNVNSAIRSWPRDKLIYFETPTTRRPGTSCSD